MLILTNLINYAIVISGGLKMSFKILAALALCLCLCLGLGMASDSFNFTEIAVPIITNGTVTVNMENGIEMSGNKICDDSGCSGSILFVCDSNSKTIEFRPLSASNFDGNTSVEIIGDNGVPFHIPAPVDKNTARAWFNVTTKGENSTLTISC